jgi:pimeloyl-ACP methyl ester carboxylesterase
MEDGRDHLEQLRRRFHAEVEKKTRLIDGHNWTYHVSGRGERGVLFLVGSLCDGSIWFPFLVGLADEFRLLAPSYPPVDSMEQILEACLTICREEGMTQLYVVGQSFGGMLAQELVRTHPTMVQKLILAHTSGPADRLKPELMRQYGEALRQRTRLARQLPWSLVWRISLVKLYANLAPWFDRAAARFWRRYFAESFRERVTAEHLEKVVLGCIPGYFQEKTYTPADLDAWPGETLVIHGLRDTIMSPLDRAAMRYLYPRARVRHFAETGHMSLHVRPAEATELLRDFLS